MHRALVCLLATLQFVEVVIGFDGLRGERVVLPPADEGGGHGQAGGDQLTRAAATVRPVETSCSSWADSMGSTAWPVALRIWLVRASASAAVRAMVEGEILCNRCRAASEAAKNE